LNDSPATPQGRLARRIVARLIVTVLMGIGFGYFFGASVARDAARGRALTLKEYIADFESHKKALVKSEVPMWGALLTMVILLIASSPCMSCWSGSSIRRYAHWTAVVTQGM